MPTIADIRSLDSLGLPRFTEQQTKAMVDLVKRTGKLNSEPPGWSIPRGIVIAGGGKYLSHAWVCCKIIRKTGCKLPIRVYYMGPKEMPPVAVPWFAQLDAECVDVLPAMQRLKINNISGWTSKMIAVTDAPWEQVLFLDADCYVSRDPEELMTDPEVEKVGGLFFSDIANHCKAWWGYYYCGLTPLKKEWEAGIYVVNKRLGWMGVRWTLWLNEHSDVWFKLGHGDKATLEWGFRTSEVPIIISEECEWKGWGISQQWKGTEWARHQMGAKRNEHPWTEDVKNALWEWQSMTLGKI